MNLPGGGDNFRFFQYDIFPAVAMYASQIKLADRQRERIEQIRRQYREELNRVVAAGRANWVPCHSLTKAPVHGRPLDLKQAAVCSRRAAELQYQANMLWFKAAAEGAQVLTTQQIQWLEMHYNRLQQEIETAAGRGGARGGPKQAAPAKGNGP